MPSHGSVKSINRVRRVSTSPTKTFTGRPSSPPTAVGTAARGYSPAIRAHSRSQPQAQKLSDTLARVQKIYASAPSAKGLPVPPDIARLDVKIGGRAGISPSLLASQQQHESNFNPNAVSSAGAFGVSQFIPSTAAQYGVKPGDVKSQVRGQANYMKTLGAQHDPATALGRYLGDGNPNSSYAQGILADQAKYKQLDKPGKKPNPKDVHKLQKAGISPSASKAGGSPQHSKASKRYTNPLPGGQWTPSRTDMGKDFSAPAGAPIVALGKGTYIGHGQGAGWPGAPSSNAGVFYKLKNAKGLPSPYIYFYEGVSGNPKLQPGQKIKKGQVIAASSGGPNGIEAGFADSSGGALSVAHNTQSHSGDPGANPTPEGTAFQNLLAKLPGSNVMKGQIMSFVSSGGGGSSGVSGFSSVTGVSAQKAKSMSPQQRMMSLRAALDRTLRDYGGANSVLSGSSHSSRGPLTHLSHKPVV